jgi:hypothetical protein
MKMGHHRTFTLAQNADFRREAMVLEVHFSPNWSEHVKTILGSGTGRSPRAMLQDVGILKVLWGHRTSWLFSREIRCIMVVSV